MVYFAMQTFFGSGEEGRLRQAAFVALRRARGYGAAAAALHA